MTTATNRLPSSFRDPSGFLFTENGTLFRVVSQRYRQHYDHLVQSGLYDKLVENNLLIPHQEVTHSFGDTTHRGHVPEARRDRNVSPEENSVSCPQNSPKPIFVIPAKAGIQNTPLTLHAGYLIS